MSEKDYKRKTYVVNKQLQFRMIATFLVSVLIALVIFTLSFIAYYWFTTKSGDKPMDEIIRVYSREKVADSAGNESYQSVETITDRWSILVPPVLINNILIMIVIAVIGVFYSHRIAGPIFRIKADIEKVLSGDKDVRIVIRKKDKLHDLAESVNLLLEELQKSRQG